LSENSCVRGTKLDIKDNRLYKKSWEFAEPVNSRSRAYAVHFMFNVNINTCH